MERGAVVGVGEGRVVVGVSDTPAGIAALRTAAAEARNSGRRLVAVYAWEPPEGEVLYLRNPDRAWATYWRDQAGARLDAAFTAAFGGPPPGVDVQRTLIRARPHRALLTTASRPEDLLVLGAGGRIARRVRRRARGALLTVPAPSFPRGLRRRLRRITVADVARAS